MNTSLPAVMRAQVLATVGEPLRLSELPVPSPGPGEVLVRIAAAGLNPLDTKIAAGEAAHAQVTTPAVLGLDAAGTVAATGAGVTGFDVGDEVYGMIGGVGGVQGSLAEYAAVDTALLAHKPAEWSMPEAAALPLSVITAWEGLVDRAGRDTTSSSTAAPATWPSDSRRRTGPACGRRAHRPRPRSSTGSGRSPSTTG